MHGSGTSGTGHGSASRGAVSGSRVTVRIDADPPPRGWLKPALVVGGLLVAAAVAFLIMGSGNTGMPDSFPNAMIPLRTAGTPADVRIVHSALAPGPGEVDGVPCWPAWQCNNDDCPGRGPDHRPFIFPHSDERPKTADGPFPYCPRCATAQDKRRDPTNIAPYYTDEARQMMERRK